MDSAIHQPPSHGNVPGDSLGGTWRGFQGLSRCPEWELGGIWDTWSARTWENEEFGWLWGRNLWLWGSLRSLPIQSTQGHHHGEELLAGAGLEVEAGEGHEDPAELGHRQVLSVLQAVLRQKREFGAVQNGRDSRDTSARDTPRWETTARESGGFIQVRGELWNSPERMGQSRGMNWARTGMELAGNWESSSKERLETSAGTVLDPITVMDAGILSSSPGTSAWMGKGTETNWARTGPGQHQHWWLQGLGGAKCSRK